eukprot:1147439-Pelagomonas_calceolata.AAC.6
MPAPYCLMVVQLGEAYNEQMLYCKSIGGCDIYKNTGTVACAKGATCRCPPPSATPSQQLVPHLEACSGDLEGLVASEFVLGVTKTRICFI